MTEGARCHNCGTPVEGSALFCPRCGVDVSSVRSMAATAVMPAPGETEAPRVQSTLRQNLRDATLGEYEVLAELGRGGMATVFLAHEIALDRKVAVKVMAPHLFEGEGMVERFKLEARTAAQLSHPHIIPIYAVRETESTIFFVMKFIEGRGLDTIIKKLGPLPIPMVKDVLSKVGVALGYAHRRGVVHRDVKPSNVMIDEEGTPIMTDFGIAKVQEARGLTMTGATIGTPSYMSPEQCEGREVTGASDQYSLGIVAFEMLTGKLPFVGDSAVSTMYKHVHEALPPLVDFRPDCPGEIVETVTRMLAKGPEERWPSLEAAVQKLGTHSPGYFDPVRTQLVELAREGGYREILDQIRTPSSPVPAARQPTPPAVPAAPPPPRSRRWVAAAAAVVALGGAGAVVVLQPWDRAGDGPVPQESGSQLGTAPTPGGPEGVSTPARQEPELVAADAGDDTGRGAADSATVPSTGQQAVPVEPPPQQRPTAPPQTAAPPPSRPAGPAPVASVRLRGTIPSLTVGQSAVFSVASFDANNAELTDRRAAWSSSEESVARVDATGRVEARAPGQTVITAFVEGVPASHTLTVAPVPVASIDVSPTTVSLQAGGSQQLEAQPRARDGSQLGGRSVTFVSRDPQIASVSATGLVRALAAGQTTIVVTSDAATGSISVTVEANTRETLDALIQAYARAFESGDVDRVRAAYPGIPADQADALARSYRDMRNIQAVLSIGEVDESGTQATAHVAGTYNFVNATNGRDVRQAVTFTAVFRRGPAGWYLASLRPASQSP